MTVPAPRRRRIGLFGGSFDPPHRAHRLLADTALATLALDQLRWLPAGTPWQKSDRTLAEPRHRAAMVALAIEGEPRFVLDERELQRRGPSYTIDSVRELRAEEPDALLFVVIGQDQYRRLHTWHAVDELLGLVTWAVAAREGQVPQADAALAHRPLRVELMPMPRLDVSATVIRQRAARGEDLTTLVAPAVARYIALHQLYRDPAHP
jgi:nicotinate-nucleotide adenylyltransferase